MLRPSLYNCNECCQSGYSASSTERESRVSDQSGAPLLVSNTTVRIQKHDRYTLQYLYPLFKKLINELKFLVLVSLALMEEIIKIPLVKEVICLLI